MALTDRQIKAFTVSVKDQWFSDEKGLRLLVKNNGSKYWRLNYRFDGKQKTLALGVYPDISLKEARIERDKARLSIRHGVDPSEEKREKKRRIRVPNHDRFSILAREWWENYRADWSEDHGRRVLKRLDDNAFPELDKKPVDELLATDILIVVRAIEGRGATDVAKRVLQAITAIFRYGIQIGRLKYNPASDLAGVVRSKKTEHRASLPNAELGQFLRDLPRYEQMGRLLTQYAIQLLVLTFVRPGELRGARWEEFELDKNLWRVPAARMKMKAEHLVPLSDQAIKVLDCIRPLSGGSEMLFPSERNPEESMSDNTMRRAIFRLGYDGSISGKSKVTPHGFRANASSILNEQGFNPDAIERQLSHMERNGVRAAYTHHARYMSDRVELMQWWANYLDERRLEDQT